jgi:anti-sigma regulatory factor (Ser/Thr protein kinase)
MLGMSSTTLDDPARAGYRHEALLYANDDEFMHGTLGFIGDAAAAEEPILVLLDAVKIDMLRRELPGERSRLAFADMAEIGTNPARIIPAWQEFVAHHSRPGRRVRGIGEPIWASHSSAELVECQRHEALLNVAFAAADFWLLCPYDTAVLDAAVLEEAERNHPYVRTAGIPALSSTFPGVDVLAAPFAQPLPEPPARVTELRFDAEAISEVRRLVASHATSAGLAAQRVADLALAAHELAANSIRHGGGRGTLRIWTEADEILCEVLDQGCFTDPLLDRTRPSSTAEGSRGLWLANQLCELVQLRSFEAGTAIRLHMRRS